MDFSIGQVVFSKAGRDKKRPFTVLRVDGEYLFLADGSLRPVIKPKKKKIMHVQPTNSVNSEVAGIIEAGGDLKDSDVRKALAKYLPANI